MCIAAPAQIMEINDNVAIVDFGGVRQQAKLDLVGYYGGGGVKRRSACICRENTDHFNATNDLRKVVVQYDLYRNRVYRLICTCVAYP